ncbi:Ubiquitin-like protein 3, partial [Trachymyrmex cornetzi]
QINLRLILVSGKTKEFLFSPSDSAGDIAHHVFENWPEGELVIAICEISCKCYLGVADWAEEAVAKAEILRLIYQGRFLHSNVTLGALGLPFGKTTVMHLVPRENLPEPNSQGEFARCDHVISSFVKVVTKLLVCLFLHFPRQTLHQTRTKFAFLTLFETNFIKES